MYICLGLLLAMVAMSHAASRNCYNFRGDSYLEFSTSSLDISNSVHYSLKFRTGESSGLLLYSEGDDDYEGLFIYDGRLMYLLTNPSPSGVEGTVGGFHQGEVAVNDRSWFTVELWRNWEVQKRAPLTGTELRTGFIIYDSAGNKLEEHIDNLSHRNVVLDPTIFIGGISSAVDHVRGSHIPPFKGQVKEIKEERNGLNFTSYSVNSEGKVKRCS